MDAPTISLFLFSVFLKLIIDDRPLRPYINTFYESEKPSEDRTAFSLLRMFRIFKSLLNRSMNAHYRTLAEYILREITLQQNHSQTFMQKVDHCSLSLR